MRKILAVITVLGFVSACTKAGKNISITGFVKNPVSGEVFSDVQIKLLKTSGGLPGGFEEVKSVFTNTDGYFEIHHLGGSKNYYIQAIHGENYPIGWFWDGEHQGNIQADVTKREYMSPEYRMVPFGRYQIVVNNINCQGPTDTIIINQSNQVGSFLDNDWILTGCNGFTTGFDDVPMGWISIDWTVIRGGVSDSYSDQVFLGEGQQLTYNLDY